MILIIHKSQNKYINLLFFITFNGKYLTDRINYIPIDSVNVL